MNTSKRQIIKWICIVFLFITVKIFCDIISNPSESIDELKNGFEYIMHMKEF